MNITSNAVFFWDYENVALSSQRLTYFLAGIDLLKKQLSGTLILKVFSHWDKTPENIQLQIYNTGFELVQVPINQKDSLDQLLIATATNLLQQITFTDFFLISGDGGYLKLIQDLNGRNIATTIISNQNVSQDLLKSIKKVYSITPDGIIFYNESILKKDLIPLIEIELEAAKIELNRLYNKSNPTESIFHYAEWVKFYQDPQNITKNRYQISQILDPEKLFQLFIQYNNYGHSKNYRYVCVEEIDRSPHNPLDTLSFISKLPESIELTVPILEDFSLLSQKPSSVTTQKDNPKKPNKNSNATQTEKDTYQNQLIAVLSEKLKEPKGTKLNIAVINESVCKICNIPISKKIYKQFGHKTLSKYLTALISQHSWAFKVNKGHLVR